MRFLLYNIRYAAGTGRHFHLPFPFSGYFRPTQNKFSKIVDFIKFINPDIIGLVEVDSGSLRTGKNCQAETVARELSQYHVFESKYSGDSLLRFLPIANKQGNAFLTSENIKGQHFHYFTKGIKRLVIELEMEDFTIFLVHLSVKFRHRQHQLRHLYTLVKEIKKPFIIAGDFNPFWGDHELHLFLAATGLQSANTEGLLTYPSRSPKRELDFILHSKGIQITRFEIPHVQYSDHLPLVCDFELTTLGSR